MERPFDYMTEDQETLIDAIGAFDRAGLASWADLLADELEELEADLPFAVASTEARGMRDAVEGRA